MSTDYVASTLNVIRNLEAGELMPYAIRLLSKGEPVPLESLAAASRWPLSKVKAALDRGSSAELDEQGRLVGFVLTLRPTPHRFTVDGQNLFAWCADDTLMFPVILGVPAHVESKCPQTGQPIRVKVAADAIQRVDPPEAVVPHVRPTGKLPDIRATTCQLGHFFSSRAAAAQWAEKHPSGTLHSVPDAFWLGHKVIEQLGWTAGGDSR